MNYAVGIDLGGTRIKAAAVTPGGDMIEQVMRRTSDRGDAPWVEGVREVVSELEAAQEQRAAAIGVCAPGIASPDGKCIAWMMGRMEQLVDLNWTDVLQREALVPVLNDGQAALLGEVWQGAAKGCRDVVLLTLGTGVGGAIMADGRLLKGRIGRAGHLGHVSVDANGPPIVTNCPGALEYYIGNFTIEQRSEGQFATTYELLEAYRAGDKRAAEIWLESVRRLAVGLVSIINAIDPEKIVLAGGVAEADSDLFGPLSDYLDQYEWRPHGHRVAVVKAAAGEFAGALGAAHYAMLGGKA